MTRQPVIASRAADGSLRVFREAPQVFWRRAGSPPPEPPVLLRASEETGRLIEVAAILRDGDVGAAPVFVEAHRDGERWLFGAPATGDPEFDELLLLAGLPLEFDIAAEPRDDEQEAAAAEQARLDRDLLAEERRVAGLVASVGIAARVSRRLRKPRSTRTRSRTASARAVPDTRELAAVAEAHDPGEQPPAGQAFLDRRAHVVYWIRGARTTDALADRARRAFVGVEGVAAVHVGTRTPDDGDGWVQVWPVPPLTAAAGRVRGRARIRGRR